MQTAAQAAATLSASAWEFSPPEGMPLEPGHSPLYSAEKARLRALTMWAEDFSPPAPPKPAREPRAPRAKSLTWSCRTCGEPITQRPGRGRPRVYCPPHQAPHRRVTA